jgi:hypothetical protein
VSAALARSLAVVALLLAALPLGAQVGPGVQHLQQQVRPAPDTPVERLSPILAVVPNVIGLVAYLCRSDYSFRLPGVRRPGGSCPPKLNAFGAGYRSR